MEDNRGNALLFELRGENPGAVHVMSGDVFRIGSDEENELVLKDRHVALYQAEIHVLQNLFTLKNLNLEGTAYLNGETFEETALHKGDVLTFGESIFRFVEPGETFTLQELWKPVGGKQDLLATPLSPFRRAPYLMVLTLLAVVAVVLIMWKLNPKREETLPESRDRIARFEGGVSQSKRRTMYSHAMDLLSARRWDEAVFVFDKIRKDTPSYKDTDTLYNKALLEGDSLDALNQAKGIFLEGNLPLARKHLHSVSERSVYHREALRFLREIRNQFMDTQILLAEKHLEQKDWALAKSLARTVLNDQPENLRARQILRLANLQQGRLERGRLPYVEVRGMQEADREHVSPAPVPVRRLVPGKKAPPRGTPEWYFHQSASVYRKGDVDQSVRVLEGMVEKGTGGGSGSPRQEKGLVIFARQSITSSRRKGFKKKGVARKPPNSGRNSSRRTGRWRSRERVRILRKPPLLSARSITKGARRPLIGRIYEMRFSSGTWPIRFTQMTKVCKRA